MWSAFRLKVDHAIVVEIKRSDWDNRVNTVVNGELTAQSEDRGVTPGTFLKNNHAFWCVLAIFIV